MIENEKIALDSKKAQIQGEDKEDEILDKLLIVLGKTKGELHKLISEL